MAKIILSAFLLTFHWVVWAFPCSYPYCTLSLLWKSKLNLISMNERQFCTVKENRRAPQGLNSIQATYGIHANQLNKSKLNFSDKINWTIKENLLKGMEGPKKEESWWIVLALFLLLIKRRVKIIYYGLLALLIIGTKGAIVKTFGGDGNDQAWSITPITGPGGGYYVAGYSYSYQTGGVDMWVLRLNTEGEEVWRTVSECGHPDQGRVVVQTQDGGCIVGGFIQNMSGDWWHLLKLRANGSSEWNRLINMPGVLYGVVEVDDEYYIGVGEEGNVAKISKDGGTIAWHQVAVPDITFRGAVQLDNGKVAAIGYREQGSESSCNYALIDFDRDTIGNVEGIKFEDYPQNYCFGISKTTEGNLIVAGRTAQGTFGSGDAWIIKLSPIGGIIWSECFGSPGYDYAYSVNEMTNGDLAIVGGTTYQTAGGGDMWIFITDADGKPTGQSAKFGFGSDEAGYSGCIGTDKYLFERFPLFPTTHTTLLQQFQNKLLYNG
eukprot:TRINITY_DN1104_c0_g1_i2.p2 TRINITY_DN1104_c0_g1~~TRINITY_DN1104_c0_g1_i2.p2  ORF type:complete len:492 (-),score=21.00 TRINITY_DN1104_c0_g1_i2:3681-5156(-)